MVVRGLYSNLLHIHTVHVRLVSYCVSKNAIAGESVLMLSAGENLTE